MADSRTETLGERFTFGPFCLIPSARLLTKDGDAVEIGGRSFDILVALTELPGQVFSKRDLLKRVWPNVVVEDGSLRFHMAALRKILGDGNSGTRYISTQVGVGYAFVMSVERSDTPLVISEDDLPEESMQYINVPPRLTALIGREHEVALLAKKVTDTPLFTIVGAAGAGKTAMAIEIGHRSGAAFEGRVSFVDFSRVEEPSAVPSAIAAALDIATECNDPLAAVYSHLSDRSVLLIFDNCEHLIDEIAVIAEQIVAHRHQTHILATSREPMRARGEHIYWLDGLAYPVSDELSLEEMIAYPAMQLFCERAIAAHSSLKIDLEAAEMIAKICRRFGGIPLAIEIAAMRSATHGFAGSFRQMGDRTSLHWLGLRTAQPRQQSMQASVHWSYDLLSEDEQLVLEGLSPLVGPFSLTSALAFTGVADLTADKVTAALDALTSKSLIACDRSQPSFTFRILEPTRTYAREKLAARSRKALYLVPDFHAPSYHEDHPSIDGRDAMVQDPAHISSPCASALEFHRDDAPGIANRHWNSRRRRSSTTSRAVTMLSS